MSFEKIDAIAEEQKAKLFKELEKQGYKTDVFFQHLIGMAIFDSANIAWHDGEYQSWHENFIKRMTA